jgi:hypothetical protein
MKPAQIDSNKINNGSAQRLLRSLDTEYGEVKMIAFVVLFGFS